MPPLVSDLMETEVVTIGADSTLKEAGTLLYEAGVGSLIVHSEDSVPIGIISTTDLLRAITESDREITELPVSEYMSRPLLTIRKDRPVRTAVRKMNQEGVQQLAIVDEYQVTGIIALNDVMEAYESLIKAAHFSERDPRS